MKTSLIAWREWVRLMRPWWWWINPWLYIKRRDDAYADCLETMEECGRICTDDESQPKEVRGHGGARKKD